MTHDGPHAAFRQLAAIAVDFELAPEQRRELDAHLAGCGECRRFAAALAGDRALLRDRRREVPPRRLDDAVLAVDGTAGWTRPTFRLGLSWPAVAVALLSLALLASVAFVGARLLLRPPVTDIVQPGPAQPLGDLPLLGRVGATIPVPIGNAAGGHDCHIIPASGCATAVAATRDAIWVTTTNGIARIDPATNRVVTTIPLGDFPRAIAISDGIVWVAVGGDRSVVAINAATNQIEDRIPVDGIPAGLAIDARAVWATVGDQVVEIDPSTRSIRRSIHLLGTANGVAAVDGVLVLAMTDDDAIAFVDEDSGDMALALTSHLAAPWQVRAVGSAVWYVGHNELGRIDVASRSIVKTILAPTTPELAIGSGPAGAEPHVWLVSAWNRGVEDIDPALDRAVSGLSIDTATNWLASIAVADGTIWVRLYDPDVTLRITPDQRPQ